MITEAEAKTKWCPYQRSALVREESCIASECMAWRWVNVEALGRDELINEAAHYGPLGYCGAFGNPQ